MKRNLTGEDAYLKMLDTTVPEKTDTYTPIRHQDVILHMRKEVMNAKFIITGEDYKCNAAAKYNGIMNEGGTVGLGMIRIRYKEDPDLVLTATFLNSYNKQVAFRFALGAEIKVDGKLTGNSIMLENDIHGFYRRVHTGEADIMSTGTMTDLISNAEAYWNTLVERKNHLMEIDMTWEEQHHILGMLFLRRDLITTFQLNIIKKESRAWENRNSKTDMNAWTFYNIVAEGIKDTHPAEWMEVHARVQDVFDEQFRLSPAGTPAAPSFVGTVSEDEDEDPDEAEAEAQEEQVEDEDSVLAGAPFVAVTEDDEPF